jgi:hypothetical protein
MSRLHTGDPVIWSRRRPGGRTARTYGTVAARRGGRAWVAFLGVDGSQILHWCPIAQLARLRLRTEAAVHREKR